MAIRPNIKLRRPTTRQQREAMELRISGGLLVVSGSLLGVFCAACYRAAPTTTGDLRQLYTLIALLAAVAFCAALAGVLALFAANPNA